MNFQCDNGTWWGIEGDSKVRVFRIPEANLPSFEDQLRWLVRRAKRLRVEIPSYKVEGEEFEEVIVRYEDDAQRVKQLARFVYITLHYPQVQVAGYQFMAALEHTDDGNILHVLEDKGIPAKYRNADAWCDHCCTNRYRKETFILQKNATGGYTQVGRNCLGDYLGMNAEKYADVTELYSALGELASASEIIECGRGWPSYEMLERYLSYVAEVISHIGWKSRSAAKLEGVSSTADEALRHLYRSPNSNEKDYLFHFPSEDSLQLAKKASLWAEALSDEEVEFNDYLFHMRLIARRGVVGAHIRHVAHRYGMA